jgi:hypothetical protein
MSYWKHEKVASVKEMIEKLTEYENEYGCTAITSIGFVCGGTRQTEYFVEVQDSNAENKKTIAITSITMGELNENEEYKKPISQTPVIQTTPVWHDVKLDPEDMPPINKRVLLEFVTIDENQNVLHMIGHRREDNKYALDINPELYNINGMSLDMVAWQEINPHTK